MKKSDLGHCWREDIEDNTYSRLNDMRSNPKKILQERYVAFTRQGASSSILINNLVPGVSR